MKGRCPTVPPSRGTYVGGVGCQGGVRSVQRGRRKFSLFPVPLGCRARFKEHILLLSLGKKIQ